MPVIDKGRHLIQRSMITAASKTWTRLNIYQRFASGIAAERSARSLGARRL